MTFTASLLVLCFWTALTNVAGAVTFAVLFGAFSGAVIGLPPASIMFILHHDNKGADKLRVGQWTGMMYTFAAVFALIGPIISGAIIQTTGKYLGSQLWSGICLLLSSLCMGMAYYYADGKVKDKLYATRLGLSWTKLAGMISTVTSRNPSRQPSLSVSDNEEDRGRQDTVTEMVQYRGEEGEKDSSSPQRGGPETPAPVHLHA